MHNYDNLMGVIFYTDSIFRLLSQLIDFLFIFYLHIDPTLSIKCPLNKKLIWHGLTVVRTTFVYVSFVIKLNFTEKLHDQI